MLPTAAPCAASGTPLDALVVRQAGVVTLAQVAAAGVPRRTVNRWARGWTRWHPGVYLIAGHRPGAEARTWAALLWAGTGAVLAGRTAAWWLGMQLPEPETVELVVPHRRRTGSRPGVVVRRQDLPRADLVVVRGAPCVGVALAALQAAVLLPPGDGSAFLDRCLQRHVGFPALYRSYCRYLGRRESAAMGRLVGAAADRADSAAERLLVRLLRAAGLRGWAVGLAFGPYVLDVAFPAAMLAVEVDGWAWHADADRFRSDRRKGNALVGAGWTVLRFTWHDLTSQPERCVADIRAALARAAA